MAEKSISFRAGLQSNVADLLGKAGINCADTYRLITGLVSALAVYTEEGVSLTPTIFIANSADRMVRMNGAGQHIELASSIKLAEAGPQILKLAAPLSVGSWNIYVERDEAAHTCSFGVFCGSSDPTALSPDETLLREFDPEFPVVRVGQRARNKVGVSTSQGHSVEFRFNDDEDQNDLKTESSFVDVGNAICSNIDISKMPINEFIIRIFGDKVKSSHGTIVAVISAGSADLPAELADCIILKQPIDLAKLYQAHIEEGKSASTAGLLQSAVDLLGGMINSDGITVLDTQARIRGYRAFIKAADDDTKVHGGARTRAFNTLRGLLGAEIVAALFRSQDGRTEAIS